MFSHLSPHVSKASSVVPFSEWVEADINDAYKVIRAAAMSNPPIVDRIKTYISTFESNRRQTLNDLLIIGATCSAVSAGCLLIPAMGFPLAGLVLSAMPIILNHVHKVAQNREQAIKNATGYVLEFALNAQIKFDASRHTDTASVGPDALTYPKVSDALIQAVRKPFHSKQAFIKALGLITLSTICVSFLIAANPSIALFISIFVAMTGVHAGIHATLTHREQVTSYNSYWEALGTLFDLPPTAHQELLQAQAFLFREILNTTGSAFKMTHNYRREESSEEYITLDEASPAIITDYNKSVLSLRDSAARKMLDSYQSTKVSRCTSLPATLKARPIGVLDEDEAGAFTEIVPG